MPMNLKNYIVTKEMSIYEAMKVINENGKRTAFLVENGILLGVVSDGDLRRVIINKGNLDDSVDKIANYSPIFLYENNDIQDYAQFMIEHAIIALPIVDSDNRIVKIEFLTSPESSIQKIESEVPVVVMAGGKGTRLKPYTDIIPKPLIPIGEKTITEHIIDRYAKYGCMKYYVVVNYKKNLIKAYFNETEMESELSFVEEETFLGTAGGLKLLPKEIGETFFVTNCDILVEADYKEIYDEHIGNQNIITMVIAKKNVTIPYGTVNVSTDGKVVSLEEKPTYIHNINTGMYLIDRKALDYIKEEEFLDMPTLIQRCMDAGENVGSYQITSDEWLDMGQSDELERMKKKLNLL